MARSFAEFGNALYTGEKSIDFVGRRKTWYTISIVLIIIAIVGPFLRGGFAFGIEFTGGSQFQVHLTAESERDTDLAQNAVQKVLPASAPRVTQLGPTDIRVQTEALSDADNQAVTAALAEAYGVDPAADITYSYIGPAWGQDITRQAIIALIVFILLAALVMAIYFRTWKMSLAALVALLHDLVITAGIYGISGFEITPAAMIGFLTILGYSLYDTVVVFDKIRENTVPAAMGERTFSEAVNLGVNQTLVRSINTSVVALLPVASILFIGAFVLGAGTLRDISLALFIGILVGAYSTIFIAAPVYAQLREGEPELAKHDEQVLKARLRDAKTAEAEAAEAAEAIK